MCADSVVKIKQWLSSEWFCSRRACASQHDGLNRLNSQQTTYLLEIWDILDLPRCRLNQKKRLRNVLATCTFQKMFLPGTSPYGYSLISQRWLSIITHFADCSIWTSKGKCEPKIPATTTIASGNHIAGIPPYRYMCLCVCCICRFLCGCGCHAKSGTTDLLTLSALSLVLSLQMTYNVMMTAYINIRTHGMYNMSRDRQEQAAWLMESADRLP